MTDKELINHLQKKNAEYIETIQALKKGWISVKDKLPDNYIHKHGAYKEFIVLINRASCATTLRYDGKSFYDDEFNSYNVTHWMPLPEPPKEC